MKVNSEKCGIINWKRTSEEETCIKAESCFVIISEVKEYTYLGICIKNNMLGEDIVKQCEKRENSS
jgi:hypothetical protein